MREIEKGRKKEGEEEEERGKRGKFKSFAIAEQLIWEKMGQFKLKEFKRTSMGKSLKKTIEI